MDGEVSRAHSNGISGAAAITDEIRGGLHIVDKGTIPGSSTLSVNK